MRGFRGSRAAQAFNARFNRTHGRPEDRKHGPNPQGQGPHPVQRPQLPDWLKTPETKAQEAAEAQNPPAPPAPTPPKGQLKLVPQPPAESPAVKPEPKRAKAPKRKAAPAAKKPKAAGARKTSAARTPKKKAS